MSRSRILLGLSCFVFASAPARAQGVTERVSVDSNGAQSNDDSVWHEDEGPTRTSISADGRFVAFSSKATNLVAGDTNGFWDVFVHDRVTGTTERVSVDSAGVEGDGESFWAMLSADGSVVVFSSFATNLVAGDTNGWEDIFVHDRSTGITERVNVDSAGVEANWGTELPAISADGRVVAFQSWATNLVAGDTNGLLDVFVHDRSTGVTELVSVDSAGGQANAAVGKAFLSADGSVVAFGSYASNLVANDTNHAVDIFVRDRTLGVTERVSVDSAGAEANNASGYGLSISGDGMLVAFDSNATNLVPNDTNGVCDVFVHDRVSGATERVSVDSTGVEANGFSYLEAIGPDGRRVVFNSMATNLVVGDPNYGPDVFVHDRVDGATECVSVDPAGVPASAYSDSASLSSDGQVVAFASLAQDLVSGDTNGFEDVFVRELCTCPATWSNYGAGFAGTNGVAALTSRSFPAIGSSVVLDLGNSSGVSAAAVLFVGFQRATLHSSLGGDLLLLPSFSVVLALDAGGSTITGAIPRDDRLCGTALELQALEADAGAAKGVSFTQGLEFVIGH